MNDESFLEIAICRNCKFYEKGFCNEREKEVTPETSCANFDEKTEFLQQQELLKDKNLFYKITEDELAKKIVGERESRKVIFLSACGRLVKNCQIASFNLLVNDEAGTGKDYVTSKTLEIIPKDDYVHKTRISPTTFTYWHNKKYEPEWSWDGKVFYPEDISEVVLNSDVFKVMCSSGSSATIVIKQKAVDIDIEGKPVMITTTATATPNPELTRRFSILNLDSSQDQTTLIMKRHSEYKKKGIVPEYNQDIVQAQKLLKRIKVKIPFADLIDKYFPAKNIIMRTLYPRFLDYISASTALYQFQRQKDSEGFYLAEGQDYNIARECFIKLCSNKYMIPLTINQKGVLEIFEQEPNLKLSASQTLPLMKGAIKTVYSMQNQLRQLAKYGLLEESIEKDSLNRDMEVFSISKSYNPNEKLELPTYEEICRNIEVSEVTEISEISETTEVTKEKEVDTSITSDTSVKKCLNNSTKQQNSQLNKSESEEKWN